MNHPTACLIVIGNEILSGRTQDKNIAWLGEKLNDAGIPLREVRIIPDVEAEIVATVNALRVKYRYVFTTGGIGPTHDDITSECIAAAFGLSFERHPEASDILHIHYGDQVNEARLSMADMPKGAKLIPNPVSAAPGFIVENVYVMAGVPRIMQAMFDAVLPSLRGGPPVQSRTLTVFLTEGMIADGLTKVQDVHPKVEIGSYPFMKDGKLGTSLVVRSHDVPALEAATFDLQAFLQTYNVPVQSS